MWTVPLHAKKVFSGILFDIYQWEQELFDGTSTTFEMMYRRAATLVIASTPDGKVLLLEEEHPNRPRFLSLPAGLTENDETPLQTGQRELLEETWYTSADWEEYMVYNQTWTMDDAIYVYIARNCARTHNTRLDQWEKIRVMSVDFEDFVRYVTEDKSFRTIEFALHICRMRLTWNISEFQKKIFHS